MHYLALNAYAKINLVLNVIKKLPDGYHEIDSVMQTLTLHDKIILYRQKNKITLSCEAEGVPEDTRNLAFRAAKLLLEKSGRREGVAIQIEKRIPAAAGLGGGSADAATVLLGINNLYDLGYSLTELAQIGRELGADVPFCVLGGTCRSQGIGEKLLSLPPGPPLWLVLAKPSCGVSAAEAYQAWDLKGESEHPCVESVVAAIQNCDQEALIRSLGNSLEEVVLELCPSAALVKEKLLESGSLRAVLCGSGPTLMGVAVNREQAEQIAGKIKSVVNEVYVTRTR